MNTPQFSIWTVDLNPVKDSKQAGIRPCVILQTNAVSEYGKTTIIAPITSQKTDKIYPCEVILKASRENGLKVDSKIKGDQIRVVSKDRLLKQIGKLETKYHQPLVEAINIIFDLKGDFR